MDFRVKKRIAKTICIACGSPKDDYQDACPSCGFEPTSDEDLAKSRILSWEWDFGLPDGSVVCTVKGRDILKDVGFGFLWPVALVAVVVYLIARFG